jgi:hypothetical protein
MHDDWLANLQHAEGMDVRQKYEPAPPPLPGWYIPLAQIYGFSLRRKIMFGLRSYLPTLFLFLTRWVKPLLPRFVRARM